MLENNDYLVLIQHVIPIWQSFKVHVHLYIQHKLMLKSHLCEEDLSIC